MTDEHENNQGIRAALSLAPVYRLAQKAIGADRTRQIISEELIASTAADRILDIGCGTADILDACDAQDYVGFDPNEHYIQSSKDRYGDRGNFVTSGVDDFKIQAPDRTIAMAIGVLHHLPDEQVESALRLARAALVPGGRFVSIDPTLVEDQHRIAKFLVSRDRGQHVRTPSEMTALVAHVFEDHTITVRHDLLRVPYSHVLVEAQSD
jgi:SAM-dependent methyltransferase